MLQLSATIIGKQVLSLRTGQAIATITAPLIDPNSFKIEGFYCDDLYNKQQLILVTQDIREVMREGFVVNDHDVLVEENELVRLTSILELRFSLLNKQVQTVSGQKVGKVNDYAIETTSMVVQKIYVAQPILRSFTGGSLSVDRSQIQEVTDRRIIINDLLKGSPIAVPLAG